MSDIKECPDKYKLIREKEKCIDNCTKDDTYLFEFNNSCLQECPPNYTIIDNICLKIPDTIINSNLPTINSESVIETNMPTINSESVIDTNLPTINSDTVPDTNIQKININEKGECPKDFPYKLQNDRKCVKECKASDVFKGICIINNKDPTINDIMINKTRNEIINHEMDQLLKDVIGGKKENLITIQGYVIYSLTTSDNQENNKQKNESTIYLGDCENKLKVHYNISTNETLLIFKIDIFQNCSDNPIIEYEIYNPKTMEKLDLIFCNDTKIQINIPAKIDEKKEFKYNPASAYYSDICFPYTTEDETDINLNDRKIEFFVKNLSTCEPICDYEGYDSNLEKVACECYVKIKIPFMSEIVFNKDLLKRKFVDIKNLINLTVMKCYSILSTSEGLLFNIGSYIFLAIIFLNVILLIVFIKKGYKNLLYKIYKIYKKYKKYKGSIALKNKGPINNNNIIKTTGDSKIKKVAKEKKKKLKRKMRRNKRRKIIKRIMEI